MEDKIHDDSDRRASNSDEKKSVQDPQAETFEKREQAARGIFDFDENATVSGEYTVLQNLSRHLLTVELVI